MGLAGGQRFVEVEEHEGDEYSHHVDHLWLLVRGTEEPGQTLEVAGGKLVAALMVAPWTPGK